MNAPQGTNGAKAATGLSAVHLIEALTHGRYLVDRPAGGGPFPLLVGFHGYGENAEEMLDELVRVRGDRAWLVVSVQALHRFYNRSNETVVASWMTRQDREHAIADNLAYVRSTLHAVKRQYPANDVVVFAGFSQGVAMAYRAAAFAGPAEGVIALAGDLPPDVAPEAASLPPVLIGRGEADQWYTASKASSDLESFARAGLQPAVHVFAAGHVWDESFRHRAGQFLDSIAP